MTEPTDIVLRIPEKLAHRFSAQEQGELRAFLQAVVNRYVQGDVRYGKPHKSKQYAAKLLREMVTYRAIGNFEYLLNSAVYALLESIAPSNPRFHFDPSAASATRKEID